MAAEAKEDKKGIWSRRDFFTRLGWGGFAVFGLATLLGFVRSAFPRVLFEPPKRFKAGDPKDYVFGEVNEKFKQEFRLRIGHINNSCNLIDSSLDKNPSIR